MGSCAIESPVDRRIETTARRRDSAARKRHAAGSYFTPPELALDVARLAVTPLVDRIPYAHEVNSWRALRRALRTTIVDPACGDGNLLVAAAAFFAERLVKRFAHLSFDRLQTAIARRCIYGLDLQAEAISTARERLAAIAKNHELVARHFRCADSLLADVTSFWPRVAATGGFDVVVGNPPFVDAETMSRAAPDLRATYAARWSTARGNWDLSVPFVELSAAIARGGGQVSLVLPNKLLSARYAAELRRYLRKQALRSIIDVSAAGSFNDADVYPIVLHFERQSPNRRHKIGIRNAGRGGRAVSQSLFEKLPDSAWHLLLSPRADEYVNAWRNAVPLGTIAEVSGAATVAEAYEMAGAIIDLPSDKSISPEHYRVVNTGTVRRHRHAWGAVPLRYLGRRYARPVIGGDVLRSRWPRRAAQACAPKVIVAGLGKELRACWDARGELLAGKSTVVIRSNDVDLRLLTAFLNSRWMSDAYRAHFGGLALQGGYLQFTTAHLRALPFPSPQGLDERRTFVEAMLRLVDQIQGEADANTFARLDAKLESLVLQLVSDD